MVKRNRFHNSHLLNNIFSFPDEVNEAGEQNFLDIVRLINFILFIYEPTEFEFWAGDINFDGTINILDVVLLVNIILEE